SATPTPSFKDLFEQEIYTLDLETLKLVHLDITPLHVGDVMFSFDGLKLCYGRFEKENNIFNNTTVEMYDLNTKHIIDPLSHSLVHEHVLPVRWTEKGSLVTVQEQTNLKMGLGTETGEWTPLTRPEDRVATAPSITADGKHF